MRIRVSTCAAAALMSVALGACAGRSGDASAVASPAGDLRTPGQEAVQPVMPHVTPAVVGVTEKARPFLPAAEAGRADAQGVSQRVSLEQRAAGRWPLVRVEEDVAADGTVRARREMVGDHVLVSARPGTTAAAVAALAARHGCAVRERIIGTDVWLLSFPVPDHRAHPAAILALAGEPGLVSVAEPDWIVSSSVTPTDPLFGQLWGLHNDGQAGGTGDADIDAPGAWEISTGSRAVVVGVIDTGIDAAHPDLAANMWSNPGETGTDAGGADKRANGIDDDGNGYIDDWRGWDFVANDNNPADEHGHGTHCAGTIGGLGGNGVGVAGVCWQVSLVGLRFLDASGHGSTSGAIAAVAYANTLDLDLTSNSWGGGGFSQALKDVIDAAGTKGIPFIAAAGNNSSDTDASINYPSCYASSNIISVAATTRHDGLAYFSNYGLTTVDLGAPGLDILSCAPGGGYQLMSGTSMATPHVAGAYALLKSVAPSLTVPQAKAALLATTDPIAALGGKAVAGRLNLQRAVESIAGPVLQVQAFQLIEQGDGDGWISPGESAQLRWQVANIGSDTATGTMHGVTCPDARVAISGGSAAIPALMPGQSVWIDGFIAQPVAGAAMPIATSVQLALTLTAPARSWSDVRPFAVMRIATLSGIVRQQSDNAPIIGAQVAWSGSRVGSLMTGAGGLFSTRLPVGSYCVAASAPGRWPSAAQPVVLPPDAHVALFLSTAPDLVPSPTALAITVAQGAAASAPLRLANSGGAVLTWSSVQPSTTSGLWHRSSYRDFDTGGCWYYGQESTRTYDTGAANAGDLVFDGVAVPAGSPTLTFQEWRLTEGGNGFDRSTVEVANAAGGWIVAGQSTWQGASWSAATVSLATWAGTTVRLRFRFDTVDHTGNVFEGWYIDDLRIGGSPLVSGSVSMSPAAGSIPGGAWSDTLVTAASGSLAPGTYPRTLRLASNDPDQPTTDIPVNVIVTASTNLVFATRWFADGGTPPAAGDGDGFAEPGETVGLTVQVGNAGSIPSAALSGTLSCSTAGVTIPDASYPLAAVAAGATASGPSRGVVIGSAIADGTILSFTLTLSDGTRTWSLPFTLPVDRRIRVTGVVRSEPANAALINAEVIIAGQSVYSGFGGAYAFGALKPGALAASASYPGFLTQTATLSLGADGTWNPVLGTRRLSIAPLLIDRTVTKGTADSTPLALGATGTRPVTFSIAVPAYPGEGTTPWLTVSPSAGTINPAGTSALTVTGASALLTPGIYERTIQVSSNDTVAPSTAVIYRLRVQSANAPVVQPLSATTTEDTAIDVPLTATDADGDLLTLAIATAPAKGTATITGKVLRYVPTADVSGIDTLQVTASDGMRVSAPATVTIVITPVNDAPQLGALSIRAGRDVGTSLHLSARDPDGLPLAWSITLAPAHGALAGTAPDLVYRPHPGFTGTDGFTVRVTDADGMTAQRSVPITVEAQSDQWTTFGNGVARTGFTAVGLPATISTATTWTATFDHQLNQVAAGGGLVHVTPFKYAYGSLWVAARNLASGAQVWRKDLPDNGAEVDPPTWDAGQILFQRNNHASDSQLYAVDAASGATIWTAPFRCQWENYFAPLAVAGRVYVNGGYDGGMYGFERTNGAQTFFLPGPSNDLWSPSWYEGGLYSFVGANLRAHDPATGAVLWAVVANGTGNSGSMNRVAVLADGLALVIGTDGEARLTAVDLATHAIRWSVAGPFVGNPAVANGRVFAGWTGGLRSFDLASGAALETYSGAGAFTGLQPIVTTDGLIGRCGSTSAVWRIGQAAPAAIIPFGGHLSLAGTTLLVAENTYDVSAPTGALRAFRLGGHPPIASGSSATGAEDTVISGAVPASDADGDTLKTTLGQAPAHGTVVLSGLNWTYLPAANWSGSDAFTVLISDGKSSVAAPVALVVTAVNDVPVVAGAAAVGSEDTVLIGTIVATDVDGDALVASVGQVPAHGTVGLSGLTWAYVPAADWSGSDSFTVLVSDGVVSAPAAVQVTIAAINDPPVATALVGSTPANVALTLTPSAVDMDGDPLTWQLVALPTNGIAAVVGGQLRYTPSANWTGTAVFTYAPVDGGGIGTAATVTVTVRGEGIPMPWIDRPIGVVAGWPAGGTLYGWTSRQFAINGPGADIGGTADQFRFVSQPVSGDVTISGQVLAQVRTDGLAKAGFMIRQGTAVNASNVFICQTPDNGILLQSRSTAGGTTTTTSLLTRALPWLKLQRSGNQFTAWTSADGVAWGSPVATQTVAMEAQVEVGMAVTSHKISALSSSRFHGVKVLSPAAPAGIRGMGFVPAGVPMASREPAGR